MNAISSKRVAAVLRKEWIQLRRDPMTLRMIIALPVMQLFLFGYAINANPKNLPTGLLSATHSKYERTIVTALQNTGYYDVRSLRSEAEAERALSAGEVLFVINIPANFDRSLDRGEKLHVVFDPLDRRRRKREKDVLGGRPRGLADIELARDPHDRHRRTPAQRQ